MRLRGQLASGGETDLSIWLTTLEQMTMYEQYFSKDELARALNEFAARERRYGGR